MGGESELEFFTREWLALKKNHPEYLPSVLTQMTLWYRRNSNGLRCCLYLKSK